MKESSFPPFLVPKSTASEVPPGPPELRNVLLTCTTLKTILSKKKKVIDQNPYRKSLSQKHSFPELEFIQAVIINVLRILEFLPNYFRRIWFITDLGICFA